jgi:hypothetical protein
LKDYPLPERPPNLHRRRLHICKLKPITTLGVLTQRLHRQSNRQHYPVLKDLLHRQRRQKFHNHPRRRRFHLPRQCRYYRPSNHRRPHRLP